jgi:hypothetical protein
VDVQAEDATRVLGLPTVQNQVSQHLTGKKIISTPAVNFYSSLKVFKVKPTLFIIDFQNPLASCNSI